MAAVPTPQELADLPHPELERLALQWRSQAAHGVRAAFGMAHALEVEMRRRERERRTQDHPALAPLAQRSWKKTWGWAPDRATLSPN